MSFSSIQITAKGRALLAKAQIGATINFTRIKMGDGSMTGQNIDDMTDVISQKASLSITQLKVLSGGKAKVQATFNNSDISTGFYWRELAVFATDPSIGEIMYCYGNAGALADYIPAAGSQILERVISVLTIISNAANVTASIDQSLVYVTQQEFTLHSADYTEHIVKGNAGGSSTAYTITVPQWANETRARHGMEMEVQFSYTCGNSPTLNVNGWGAKAIVVEPLTAYTPCVAGDIVAEYIYTVMYHTTTACWVVKGVRLNKFNTLQTTVNAHLADTTKHLTDTIQYFTGLKSGFINNQQVAISDGGGSGLFPFSNSLILLYAIDKGDPNSYILAMGWKGIQGVSTHVLTVIKNNALTLGANNNQGTQVINGGTATNIISYGVSIHG